MKLHLRPLKVTREKQCLKLQETDVCQTGSDLIQTAAQDPRGRKRSNTTQHTLKFAQRKMPKRLYNPMWLHFTEPVPGRGKCIHCDKIVSMGSASGKTKNTTNLWRHLETHHKDVFQEAKQSKEEMKKSVETQIQESPTTILSNILLKEAKWKENDFKSKKIDKLIAEMCATDELAFSVVSGQGFKRLVAALEPKYELKSEKFYRSDLLENLYKRVHSCIRGLVSSRGATESFLSFTVDCLHGEVESIMILTCHFIDDNWERRKVVLHVKAMTEASIVSYVHQFFLPLLTYWNIHQKRVFLVLRDGGADVSEDQRLTEIPGLSCCAHTLQTVIDQALNNSQQDVQEVIVKIRTCAGHFHDSTLAKQRLKLIQKELNVPQNHMLLDDSARWVSTLQMLRRAQEQKRALGSYAQKYGHFSAPTSEEWELAKSVMETLAPFEEVTRDICSGDSSLSCVIPNVSVLKKILEAECAVAKGTAQFREAMLRGLEQKYGDLEEVKVLVLATLLDPRYKCNALSEDVLITAPKWLCEEEAACAALKKEDNKEEEGDAESKPVCKEEEEEVEVQPPPGAGLVEQMFASLLGQTPQEHKSPELAEQLEQYLSEPLIDRKCGDPLSWWRLNHPRFDLLAPLARRLLAAPPASVPAHRVFPAVSHSSDHRTTLPNGHENAEKLCFLKHNLPLVKWEY
ncbi:hypothetical protein WMY93_028127 [Mugilogobius chulae]|uniref:BED-type domain-containing protein n=1 Tax=Mugilogobius chulae TaxID=88201 RepID=A0AAW0MU98_9GOBI